MHHISDSGRRRDGVLALYWGRRGLSQFVYEFADELLGRQRRGFISISRQNEEFPRFERFGPNILPVDTFNADTGVLTETWRIPKLRTRLAEFISSNAIGDVIDLMPHAWSGSVVPAIHAAGARYTAVVHDAHVHPGDFRSLCGKVLMDRAVRQADAIVTLSRYVARQLVDDGFVPSKITPLFHPELRFGPRTQPVLPQPGPPWRIAVLGRMLPYKGLELLIGAVEELYRRCAPVEIRIYGDGLVDKHVAALRLCGVTTVVNRWLSTDEIQDALMGSHAVLLSHVEASQSGIIAAAHGAGRPVVCTPVGGLPEQVDHMGTGVVASRPDAQSLSEAVLRLVNDAAAYETICARIASTHAARSMTRFVETLVQPASVEPASAVP